MVAVDMMISSLQKLLNENNPDTDREQIAKKLHVYESISDFEQSDLYILFDSGLFNTIVQDYTEQALKQCGLADKCGEVRQALTSLFDSVGSERIRG